MNRQEKLKATEALLLKRGFDAREAKETASMAVDAGEPLLEFLCFQTLAEHILAAIHTSSWIEARGQDPGCDGHDVINRLLESGASAKDLAMFSRMMQREYLSDLGCILDGAGIYGTPALPYEDFRIFSVDESGDPQAKLDNLHEQLGWCDLETEMRLSREAAKQRE
jgi:hypothetical protein